MRRLLCRIRGHRWGDWVRVTSARPDPFAPYVLRRCRRCAARQTQDFLSWRLSRMAAESIDALLRDTLNGGPRVKVR